MESRGATGDERFEASALDHFILLIEELAAPDDTSAATSLRRHFSHLIAHAERITDVDRLKELPLLDRQKCHRLNNGPMAGGAGGPGEPEKSMGHGALKRHALGRFMIDVERVEVAGVTGEIDNVGFSNRSSVTFPAIANGKVVKEECAVHRCGLGARGERVRKITRPGNLG